MDVGLPPRLAFVDLEMTGCSPPPVGSDRIIEIAIVEEDLATGDLRCWESLVNPGRSCTPQAAAVHGIADEVLASAPPLAALLPALLPRVSQHVVVGHGVGHDRAFLEVELPPGSLLATWWIDTARMAQKCLRLKRHNLSAVAEALGVLQAGPHRAGVDVQMTRAVFWALFEKMGRPRLDRLAQQLGSPARRAEVVEVLRHAFTHQAPVHIQYDRGRGAVSRTISITGFTGLSVSAFCHLRQADRIFRLDRIVEATAG